MNFKALPHARTEGNEDKPVVGQLAIGTHTHTLVGSWCMRMVKLGLELA